MAVSTAVPTISDQNHTWFDGRMMHYLGTLAIGASPLTYTTGGIALSLALPLLKSSRVPFYVIVLGQNGFTYVYVSGTDETSGKLKILVQDGVAQDPLTELTNGSAIPLGVSGDTIGFHAIFLGQN